MQNECMEWEDCNWKSCFHVIKDRGSTAGWCSEKSCCKADTKTDSILILTYANDRRRKQAAEPRFPLTAPRISFRAYVRGLFIQLHINSDNLHPAESNLKLPTASVVYIIYTISREQRGSSQRIIVFALHRRGLLVKNSGRTAGYQWPRLTPRLVISCRIPDTNFEQKLARAIVWFSARIERYSRITDINLWKLLIHRLGYRCPSESHTTETIELLRHKFV